MAREGKREKREASSSWVYVDRERITTRINGFSRSTRNDKILDDVGT